MIKLTSGQAVRVRRLVRRLCANCDEDGNCLLLEDGERQQLEDRDLSYAVTSRELVQQVPENSGLLPPVAFRGHP